MAAGRRTSVLTSSTRLLLALDQPARELGRGGGLAGALQAGEQHHQRGLRVQGEAGARAAQQRDQLAMQDADEGLAGREAGSHLGAQRLAP